MGGAGTTTTTSAEADSGGGGGGGGIGIRPPIGEEKVYSKIIEVVRGETDEFEIEIENTYSDKILKDLTIKLDGFLGKYISIKPSIIGSIGPGQTKSFTVKLAAPSYKESYEEHDLTATIKGKLVIGEKEVSYTEIQNILLIIQEVSREESNLSLIEAESAIQEMISAQFNTDKLKELLEKARIKLYDDRRNRESQIISEEIIKTKKQAFRVNNLIRKIIEVNKNPRQSHLLLGEVTREFKDENNNVTLEELISYKDSFFTSAATRETLNLAIAAFQRGDYDLAEERAKAAQALTLLEM